MIIIAIIFIIMSKKIYERFETSFITGLELESPVLAASFGETTSVSSVGQEIGETYDFDSAGNTFKHEWTSGTFN